MHTQSSIANTQARPDQAPSFGDFLKMTSDQTPDESATRPAASAAKPKEGHMPTKRVISILQTLAVAGEGMTLTQLAQAIDSSKGTISPILETLMQSSFIRRDRKNRYQLGRGVYIFAEAFRNEDTLIGMARHCMRRVVRACNEICQLAVLSGDEVLYIAKETSDTPLRVISRVGSRFPAHQTALGKCLLSRHSLEDLRALYAGRDAEHAVDVDALYAELQEVRRTGVGYDLGAINPELHCMGVPVMVNGRIDCAMSVSLPAFRDDEEKRKVVMAALKRASGDLERYMHGNQEFFSS